MRRIFTCLILIGKEWRVLWVALCFVLMTFGGASWAFAQKVCPPESQFPNSPPGDDSTRSSLNTESDLSATEDPEWYSMITNVPGDLVRGIGGITTSHSLEVLGGLGLLTGVLIVTDGTTYRATHDLMDRNPWMSSTSNFFEGVGNGGTHLGVAAAFALGGFIANDSRALRTASQTVEGLLVTGIVVQTLKRLTGRESPAAASASGGIWRFFPNLKEYNKNQPKYYSFPSGHIATTMTTVTIIAENYPEQQWIRPVGYGIVGLVGMSLIGVKFHWYSDLPVGVALGYAFGKVITGRDHPAYEAEGQGHGATFSVMPTVGPFGSGLTMGITL